jgi:hypothetical protein
MEYMFILIQGEFLEVVVVRGLAQEREVGYHGTSLAHLHRLLVDVHARAIELLMVRRLRSLSVSWLVGLPVPLVCSREFVYLIIRLF